MSATSGPFERSVDQHLPDDLPDNPMGLVEEWSDEAHRLGIQPNPNSMTLATVDSRGRPSARIVLCKEIDAARGTFVFYTNYQGRKAVEIEANTRAALVMHWDAMDRQVRVEGFAVRVSEAESDAYFATRPWESRIGAWASDQSQPIGSRLELADKVMETMRRFGLNPYEPPQPGDDVRIPRPPHWGGYRVYAETIELWVSNTGRVHDRAVWTRSLTVTGGGPEPFAWGRWKAQRLQP